MWKKPRRPILDDHPAVRNAIKVHCPAYCDFNISECRFDRSATEPLLSKPCRSETLHAVGEGDRSTSTPRITGCGRVTSNCKFGGATASRCKRFISCRYRQRGALAHSTASRSQGQIRKGKTRSKIVVLQSTSGLIAMRQPKTRLQRVAQ